MPQDSQRLILVAGAHAWAELIGEQWLETQPTETTTEDSPADEVQAAVDATIDAVARAMTAHAPTRPEDAPADFDETVRWLRICCDQFAEPTPADAPGMALMTRVGGPPQPHLGDDAGLRRCAALLRTSTEGLGVPWLRGRPGGFFECELSTANGFPVILEHGAPNHQRTFLNTMIEAAAKAAAAKYSEDGDPEAELPTLFAALSNDTEQSIAKENTPFDTSTEE